jgi:SpoVK/Ycf46/Vps4 family AAA+-type ATPase
LSLHYGDDFLRWESSWLKRLRQRSSGLSIFHGPPGCGKTSYIRSLMVRLLGTFEFYFVPVSTFDALDSPQFVRFWLDERSDGGKRRIAVVEDADGLLLPRHEGSQSSVSSLLNATDGLLGDHLRLQIIATTNAPVRELDSALTRPGRLVGIRGFGRLAPAQARRLAVAKGLKLPDQPDYSLGEIYCGAVGGAVPTGERQIGFAHSR